ncbi:membrane-bound PQQ-dependent dehydrogenase, glucose/quinate/shikimate family [Altericroceibacterium endophyticum]|uniref:Membrane-bound PQQ-dependent dehydrogenase, glucose/quinate/shikimate family n=1 Tax=Altericroceibacterium endophyticum TaxID=1808508 RepID=A0A6I4T4N3_9SPHN|nr:membrane-bound PQQ-dependent dehydrogenase, glucose/quinate/shikimate family [Altericroceibacterium endophyticum]MXO65003.1 membrane-bound PQQ-dependent dehydrogenase, glucose/quinate/shikimate family [Altericroceibacterium endophyticum]
METALPSPSITARIVGAIFGLLGLILAAGGIYLAMLGGSFYYLLAGVGLLVSGLLLFRGHKLGAWLYVAVFALTAIWAFWESGSNPWALIPRLVGPAILLALVALISPLLGKRTTSWPLAIGGAVVSLAFLALSLWGVSSSQAPWLKRDLPTGPYGDLTQASGDDWTSWGGTQAGQRYSTLNQITPANVDKLQRAWVSHTGDLPQGAGKGEYAVENTPLKIGNRLYSCTAMDQVVALDATTGKEIWRYDPKVSTDAIPYSASCRGVVYYRKGASSDGEAGTHHTRTNSGFQTAALEEDNDTEQSDGVCAARILWGTLDGRLIEVDADTGKPCADFGNNGEVDIKRGMGRVYPGMAAITAPPVIVHGNIVTGHQVMDGQMNDAPSGVIQAFDATTGKFAWAWDLGRPGEYGMPEAGKTYTRGTPNMWTSPSGDDALGMVYIPLGNSSSDYYSSDRSPEENEYSSSLVALNADTGHPEWKFQTVRKDVWDYDLGSQVTLVNLPGDIPAVILPSKRGDLYVLDRRTGKPLTGIKEVKAPGGGVEPPERAPYQPVSGFHNLRKPQLTSRDMWGISPVDQMLCRIQFAKADYRGGFTPPSADQHSVEYPGYNGGSDWGSVAIDPVRGVIVANYNDMPNYNKLVPRAKANKLGWEPRGPKGNQGGGHAEGAGDPQEGVPYAIDVNAGWRLPLTGLLCKEPPYGGIQAIDMKTGETIWDRPLGTARKNGPWGIAMHLPFQIGTPNNGGSVVTAGGLVFIAAATDDLIRAIDLKSGKTLWTDALPGGGQANVMTYAVNGKQYVLIVPGGHHFMQTPVSDAIIAYALPGTSA